MSPENATDKTVIWTSTKPAVATVDENGKVITVKAGTTTIRATTKDGEKFATCQIIVSGGAIAVTGVKLDKTTAELEEGKSVELKATVAPENATDNAITWKSTDEKVATVDANGKVTAVKAGKATITVITKDGAKKATCEVTVKEKEPLKAAKATTTLKNGTKEVIAITGGTAPYTIKTGLDDTKATAIIKDDKNVEITAKADSGEVVVTVVDADNAEATITVTLEAAPEITFDKMSTNTPEWGELIFINGDTDNAKRTKFHWNRKYRGYRP